jgi:hypothetical protein
MKDRIDQSYFAAPEWKDPHVGYAIAEHIGDDLYDKGSPDCKTEKEARAWLAKVFWRLRKQGDELFPGKHRFVIRRVEYFKTFDGPEEVHDEEISTHYFFVKS